MALTGVKAQLMLFEAESKKNNMIPERKESKGEPPALAKFRMKQQQLQEKKEEDDRPRVAEKPGQPNLRQNSRTEADSSDAASAGNGSVGGSGSVGKINVAKMFQQGSAPPPLKPVVPFKKPGVSDTTSNPTSPETERPKVALKPPNKAFLPPSPVSPKPFASSAKPQPSAPKPSSSVTANGDANTASHPTDTAPVKLPVMTSRPALRKTDSLLSSASSSSSGSVKLSASSHTSNITNGPIDFRRHLKPRPSIDGKVEASADSYKGSSHSESLEKTDAPKRSSTPDSAPPDEVMERQSDSKRFKKVKLSSLPPETSEAPQKPDLPDGGVDLTLICQQHANMLQAMANDDLPPPPPPDDLEEEDIYADGETSTVETREISNKPPSVRNSNRISLIPTMTAEEEGLEDDDECYGDGVSEVPGDLLYVDAASSDTKPTSPANPINDEEDEEELYMDEESIVEESEEAKKKRLKDEADAKKREQKRLKEAEKKKKAEEKEENKRRKRFNLTGDETDVGEGIIKEDAKGRNNNLTVKKGDKVTIVRLDNNPANKFLVKTETDMGYVESNNIEIDADIIRKVMLRSILSNSSPEGLEKSIASQMARDRTSMMEKGKKDSTSNAGSTADDEQEIYDDVAVDSPPSSKVNDEEIFEEEEIYQDVA